MTKNKLSDRQKAKNVLDYNNIPFESWKREQLICAITRLLQRERKMWQETISGASVPGGESVEGPRKMNKRQIKVLSILNQCPICYLEQHNYSTKWVIQTYSGPVHVKLTVRDVVEMQRFKLIARTGFFNGFQTVAR